MSYQVTIEPHNCPPFGQRPCSSWSVVGIPSLSGHPLSKEDAEAIRDAFTPPHRPLIEDGSMPFENHLYEVETPRFRAWLDEVDTMDVQLLRTRLKWTLAALWSAGEGTKESPADIDREASFEESAYNISQVLEDYAPPATARCTECDGPNGQAQDGTELPFCPICYSDDGSHCPAGDPTCEQFANDCHDTCEAPQ